MVKRRSITRFVILSIIALVLLLLTVCSCIIPFTTTNYNGFMNSIPLGFDYASGVSIVYNAEKSQTNDSTLSQNIDSSLSKLDRFFSYHGFSEYSIEKQGDSQIKIEVLQEEYSSAMLSLLESPQQIFFTVQEASDELSPQSYLSSSDISFAEVSYDQNSSVYGVNLTLTNLGRLSLDNLRSQAGIVGSDTVYIYLDEINSSNLYGQISVDDLGQSMFISSSSSSNTSTAYTNAYQTASNIFVGTFAVELSQQSMSTITPRLGENAWTMTLIALLIFVVALMAFLWIRYGDLGLIANFALIFFVTLQFFFMQAIPFVRLDLGGALAIFLSILLFVVSQIIILERIGKEYSIGNRIHVACKNGFKKSFWRLFDLHIITLVASLLMLIIGRYTISYFGGVVFIASLVSFFCLYVLFRFFVNSYLPLNSTKPAKMKLYREANVKEIKEEVQIIPEDKVDSEIKGGQA